jgi:AcrR family transcriptional regulator
VTGQTRSAEPRHTARGAATRARIVAAASELVYENGVAGTSLDDIMAASHVSKSQLYHYFADKDALVLEVIRSQLKRIVEGQEKQLLEVGSWAGLRRWRDHVVAGTRESSGVGGCPLGSLVAELADRSESAREVLDGCFAEWEAYLRRGFSTMRDDGKLAADTDPDELATAVMAALQGGLLLAQTGRTARPLELALDMALDHVARRRRGGIVPPRR